MCREDQGRGGGDGGTGLLLSVVRQRTVPGAAEVAGDGSVGRTPGRPTLENLGSNPGLTW